jgi:hypothetical protein
VNWLVRKVIDGYRSLTQRIYARRYGTLARQLGESGTAAAHTDEPGRGFIVIQVDGLAHDHLVQVLARGGAPYIKRLIGVGRLRLTSWHSGIPSTTPAVQAGIMFGRNWDIPGFRWFDKSTRRAVVCKIPATVLRIQRRVSAGRPGILRGGRSYYNMFDGDADRALFTLSALRPPRLFEGVRGLGLLLLFLLSPLRVLRIIRLAILHYLRDIGLRILAIFRPSVYSPFDLISPMTHVFTRVLFQELITFGVQMDIYHGARAIYLNNATYDEVAHEVGPTHPAAFRAIRDIDRQVAQIDKMASRFGKRQYDLYILSDHGMSPSVPFKQRFDQSLGDFILHQIEQPLTLDERWSGTDHALTQANYLMNELLGLEERLSPRSGALVRAAREYLGRRMPSDPKDEPLALSVVSRDGRRGKGMWDVDRHSDVAVRVSGPLAHVYFNVSDQRLNLSDIAVLYPALLNRLIEHPGIGLVVGREGEETVMLGPNGTLTVHPDVDQLRGSNPLEGLADPPEQAERIHRLASFPRSGDLIILGAWQNDTVVTFENQIGTHGGLGGPQERPFVLYPATVDWPTAAIKGPCDLYPIFARYANGGIPPARATEPPGQAEEIAIPLPHNETA